MAETVEEELIRKLEGATGALNTVNMHIKRYVDEQIILQKRVDDLNRALSAFEPVQCAINRN